MPTFDAITDVPGIKVGHWTDRRAATGCTVVLAEGGAVAAVDVRGGAPGTRETELLRPESTVPRVHAVLIAGGSAFGLDAASGVMRYLAERGIGHPTLTVPVPIVLGAVVYDLAVGSHSVRPGPREGYRACLAAATGPVAQGSVGAGTGATVGKARGREHTVKAGLGSASLALPDGLVVGALVVVNAVGDVVDPATGELVAGPRGEPGRFLDTLELAKQQGALPLEVASGTVVTVVATNASLDKAQCLRLAIMAHVGLARAIRPAHTPGDGDTLFVLATGEAAAPEVPVFTALGALAAQAVEGAILRSVIEARGLAGVPSARDWRAKKAPETS